jgi:hypothetical protein
MRADVRGRSTTGDGRARVARLVGVFRFFGVVLAS